MRFKKLIFSVLFQLFFPKTRGVVNVRGLHEEVHIHRDEWGVPHIYAQNQDDLFFAQGYVHAQDRFWQMEYWRHVGQGRMAEIGGPRLIAVDTFIRTMGWNRIAAATLEIYKTQEPESLKIIEMYCAGVNRYREQRRGRLSLHHAILSLWKKPWKIEPWTPLDTLSWGVVLSDSVSASWRDELLYAALTKAIGEDLTKELLPFYPYTRRPVVVPTHNAASQRQAKSDNHSDSTEVKLDVAATVAGVSMIDQITGTGPFAGSNNWVIAGQHTQSGMPLLANDPHLALQIPSIWYEIGLHASGWDVAGFSFAGVPGIVIGHNNKIAWGITNVGPDVQDLFREKINPENNQQYEYMGEWRDIETLRETIKVNGGKEQIIEVRCTHHGPIITNLLDGVEEPLAFNWAAAIPSLALKSTLLLNQAQDYEAFCAALEYLHAPAQNVVYADLVGNIAYQMTGRIPIRNSGNGVAPVPGWTGEYEWTGWIPYEQLPRLLNPECGYIVTANNAIVDEDYPYLIDLYWSDGDRAQHITEMIEDLLKRQESITVKDCVRMQLDDMSLLAAAYIPLLKELSSENEDVQSAIHSLCNWDLRMRRDSVSAALFEIFYMQLAILLLKDRLGDAAEQYLTNGDAQRVFFHNLAHQEESHWWKIQTANGHSLTRSEVLLQALTKTIEWFREHDKQNREKITWGQLHTVTFVSNPLGRSGIKFIERLVNRGPFAVDGSNSTINDTGWNWKSNVAAASNHASMRMVVDLHDFDASFNIHATGQSGHPFHRHYDDMIELWCHGRYRHMVFHQDAVMATSQEHLILRPMIEQEP